MNNYTLVFYEHCKTIKIYLCTIETIIESLKLLLSEISSIIGLPGWQTPPSSGSPAYLSGIPLPYHFDRQLPRLPGTLVMCVEEL